MLLFLGFNTSARYATIIGKKKKKTRDFESMVLFSRVLIPCDTGM